MGDLVISNHPVSNSPIREFLPRSIVTSRNTSPCCPAVIMNHPHIAILVAATLLAGCVQDRPPDRETDVTDPEVQALLAVAAAADWNSLGFSPLPASGRIRVFKKSAAAAPDANDAGLRVEGDGASRNWFFDRGTDGYRLVCASESIRGKGETLEINYAAQDPGVCGTGLKPGLHVVYSGPNGIEDVDRSQIARLRARVHASER
jgi:hypothetical protein